MNFTPFSEIPGLGKDSYCDVIGVCISSGDLVYLEGVTKREIILTDRNERSISITLLGNTANNFDGTVGHVVAVKNAKVSGQTIRLDFLYQSYIFVLYRLQWSDSLWRRNHHRSLLHRLRPEHNQTHNFS